MEDKLELERQIDELNARIKAQESGAVSGDVVTPPSNGLVLMVRDRDFECRRVGTSWQMMQFAKAQQAANISVPSGLSKDHPRRKELEEKRNRAGMLMLSTLFDTAMTLLKPSEREAFKDYMEELSLSDDPLKPGELEECIGNVIAASAGEEPGKADTQSPQSSSTSSPTTSEPVAVISLQDKRPANATTADVSSSIL